MPLIQVGAKRLHYTLYPPAASSSSPPKGITILCHHGLGSSQNFYTPIVPTLTGAGFRVLTFDATGAARSPYTQVEQSVASLAADARGLLSALGVVEPVVVVGHSMGGMVACHLAAEQELEDDKKLVKGLVLLGPVYPSEAVSEIFKKRIETVEKEGSKFYLFFLLFLFYLGQCSLLTCCHQVDAMANTIPFAAVGEKASPVSKAFIREVLLGQDKWGYLSNCRVIANAQRPRYEAIDCPVLLLAGQQDKSAPLDTSRKMIDEIGTDEARKWLEVLEGVGHWHCVEAPDVVGDSIREFLESL